MKLSKEQVNQFLPHKPPFLFVDEIESITFPDSFHQITHKPTPRDLVGSRVIAHFTIDPKLEILKGHFPGNPIYPGVIQIEMMAQASAFLSLGLTKFDLNVKVDTKLLGVDKARFRKPLLPGMKLKVDSLLIQSRGIYNFYECKVFHENEIAADAEIFAALKFE